MVEHLLVALVVLLVAAKLGGALAERLGQPAVLGELLAGVGVGALPLMGLGQLQFLGTDPVVDALADLGVILLLFEVGLSTRLADLMRVGVSAFLVATVGVVAPMILGYFVGVWLLPGSSSYVHVFLGATLSATSVGITARVLQDMGKVKTAEGQIILGAAVIDDVMGLLVLAVMVGLLGGSGRSTGVTAAIVTAKAVGFIVGALVLGRWLAPRLFRLTARLRGRGVVFTAALVTAFVLALAAHLAGLAPIVGAFAAGLVLEGVPLELAKAITARLEIPTIGIGAGKHCDGQVLVCYDLFGMNPDFKPKFVKRYANLFESMQGAAQTFFSEVRAGSFPDEDHSFRSTTMRLVASNPDVQTPDGEKSGVYGVPV